MLKDTLDRMQVVDAEDMEPPSLSSSPDDDEAQRMRYFEMLRRQQMEE